MKTKFRIVTAVICAVICLALLAACDDNVIVGNSTLLGAPKTVETADYNSLRTEGYKSFKKSVENFAADFAAYTYSDYKNSENFAVSPISVYMALVMASQCVAGGTRTEILNALGVTHEQLQANFANLYRSLEVEHMGYNVTTGERDVITGMLKLTNSIWVNDGTAVKQPCIDALSNDYYAYSYSADFARNNATANKAVQEFVKQQTKGLIDKDFALSPDTLFVLINSLYLKSVWNTLGNDLPFAENTYDFTAKDGSVKNVQLLQGYYNGGRAVDFETFSTFYTETENGYKIKFILPKDGYTVNQVFSVENIAAVNSITDYGEFDNAYTMRYVTRALFPEYKCKYDEDIAGILQDKFGINLLFTNACDFSTLSVEKCFCSKVQHVTDLTVDRKGIEGAAVTVEIMCGDSEPMTTVWEDFIVNKAFCFIITDWQGITLFSGVVNGV